MDAPSVPLLLSAGFPLAYRAIDVSSRDAIARRPKTRKYGRLPVSISETGPPSPLVASRRVASRRASLARPASNIRLYENLKFM